MIKNSEPYVLSIEYIESNVEGLEQIGNIESFGFFPTGRVHSENGYGHANFSIHVYGDKGELVVEILLEKQPDSEWEVTEMEIQ